LYYEICHEYLLSGRELRKVGLTAPQVVDSEELDQFSEVADDLTCHVVETIRK
jgi:hypothetical protein